MERFEQLIGKIVPVPMRDIDTDMIIPAEFLTSITRGGYGPNLFRRLRDSDPNFPFNLERYRSAEILVADSNFGCGSSREHAVWALKEAGIKVVISKSFADIFRNNSLSNALLPIVLPDLVVDEILRQPSADYRLTIDLKEQAVTLPDGRRVGFEFDPFHKHCLIHGLDNLDYLLTYRAQIDAYFQSQVTRRFYSTLRANNAG